MQNPLKFISNSYLSLFSLLLIMGVFACKNSNSEESAEEKQKSSLSSLATSSGRIDEVMVVMDEVNWKDSLGYFLREKLQEPYPGLPQPEPRFDLRQMEPVGLTTMLQKASSMLIVADLSSNGPTAQYVKEQINNFKTGGRSVPENMFTLKNVWSKPQQLVFVFADSEEELTKFVKERDREIINRLYVVENQKASNNLYAARINQSLTEDVKQTLNIDLPIPNSFRLVELSDSLLWIRQDIEAETSNIMIRVEPYKDQKQFSKDYAIAVRDQLGTLFTTNTPDSHSRSDTIFGSLQEQIEINKRQTIESRGLWRMTKDFMGGPYVNYLTIDEKNNRIISFDASVFAPEYKKRRSIRKLEILFKNIKF